jgi:hypothetical protein
VGSEERPKTKATTRGKKKKKKEKKKKKRKKKASCLKRWVFELDEDVNVLGNLWRRV